MQLPPLQVCASGTQSRVLLQSLMKGPTPRMPLAPNSGTVFSVTSMLFGSGTQVGLALEGSPAELAPMMCTTTPVACSPETGSEMSAMLTEPQLKPSANCRHSASTLPELLGSATAGSASDSLPAGAPAAMIRRPIEPVSISTWSIAWQLSNLPSGMQTFTVMNAVFTAAVVSAVGPASTVRLSTFGFPAVAIT